MGDSDCSTLGTMFMGALLTGHTICEILVSKL